MRNNIFYWKCDSPVSTEEKKRSYFIKKYDSAELQSAARKIAEQFAGVLPEDFLPLRAAGNHLTYHFHFQTRHYLLRLDPGGTDDDYMLAESAVMNFLHEQGLPVPRIWENGEGMPGIPFRWQIMDFADVPNLNKYAKENRLDQTSIAEECGHFLAQLHQFHFPGYGFLNTEILRENGSFHGLDATCLDYFKKCLPMHLNYQKNHGFFSAAEKRGRRSCLNILPLF